MRHPKGCRLVQEQKKAREQARRAAEIAKAAESARAAAELKASRAREHLLKQQQQAEALRKKRLKRPEPVAHKIKLHSHGAMAGSEGFVEKKRRISSKRQLEDPGDSPETRLP